MTALAPPAALALAVRLIEARGFVVSARNTRGDSVYLVKPPSAATGALPPIPSRLRGGACLPLRGGSAGSGIDDAALAIRVSNHARTAKQRRAHPDIATSLVIRTPRTAAQIAMLVEEALRNYEAARGRQAAAPP